MGPNEGLLGLVHLPNENKAPEDKSPDRPINKLVDSLFSFDCVHGIIFPHLALTDLKVCNRLRRIVTAQKPLDYRIL